VKRILALVAAVLLLATGCGGSSGTGSDTNLGAANAARVAAAPDATAKAGTARINVNVSVKSGTTTFPITGAGSFDYKRHVGELGLTLPAEFGGSLREVISGNMLYLQLPAFGPKYFVLDLDSVTGGQGAFSQLGNADPSAALETLRGAANDVQKVGTATIRGAQTTHYRGTLDLARAAANAPATVRKRLQQQLKTLTSVPFDAFIDDQGRLRKMTNHIDLGANGTVDTAVELYDFGVPVRVKVPAKSETTDGAALLRQLGGGEQ
jgi:hypothetical protein